MFANKHGLLTTLKLIAVFMISINYAYGWSGVGHRDIAKLAWSQMTPDAQDMVFKLLTSGIDIPETDKCREQFVVSQTTDKAAAFVGSVSWMDCARGGGTEYYPLPYAALVHADRMSFCPAYKGSGPYCLSARCTTNALVQAIKDLNNPWAPVKTRRVAVKIILHFLTDLHQPLHAAQPGINYLLKVDEKSEPIGMHAYWDGVVPKLVWSNENDKAALKNMMQTQGERFKTGSVDAWVKESAKRSEQTAIDLVGANNICTHNSKTIIPVTPQYVQKATEIGRISMASGAVRLAHVFNMAAVQLSPFKDFTNNAIEMSKIVKDSGTAVQRSKEINRILTTAGIDPSLVKPAEDDNDILEKTTDSLISGQGLYPGQSLLSANQRYELIMQLDNNLVLYEHISVSEKRPLWASNTLRSGALDVVLQNDGNFVMRRGDSNPVWSTKTNVQGNNRKAVIAVLQDDGNFVLYDKDNKSIWATNTWRR